MKQAIDTLFKVFRAHQKQLFIVGGAVRDMLLGKKPTDFDFATDALPDEMEGWFEHTLIIGKHYGTIGVILEGKAFEITTFRKEDTYADNRHPDAVVFTDSPKEDVLRRDFTINGLLMDEQGCVFDYVGGIKDMEKGIIRCIGDPETRFEEDRLRKWRCIRLAAEKCMEVEEETRRAILINPDISGVSVERMRVELTKIMLCEKVTWGGYLLIKTEILGELLGKMIPDYYKRCEDYLIDSFEIMSYLPLNFELRLAAFLLNMFREERKIFLREMRYSNNEKALAYRYCQGSVADTEDMVFFKKTMAGFTPDQALLFLKFQESVAQWDNDPVLKKIVEENKACYKQILENKEPLTLKDLAVRGTDLLQLGLQGEAIKENLEKMLEWVYQNPEDNTKAKLLNWLERDINGKADIPKSY